MLQSHQIEELIELAGSLDRSAIRGYFRNFQGSIPIDFTDDFLQSASLDRLRHIFVALCLQTQRMPVMEFAAAA